MFFKIEHLGLPARDPAALKEWYVRTLEATVALSNNGAAPFMLRLPPGTLIEIYAGDLALPETANNKLNGWRHVALRVDSLAEAQVALERRGVRFTETVKPAAGGGAVLFFQDPEGNLLHLVERPADSPFF